MKVTVINYGRTEENEDKFLHLNVLMVLSFKKLNKNRGEKPGIGYAVITYYPDDKEYEIIPIEDRNCFDTVYETPETAQFIYENIDKLPENTAFTIGFTKYKKIEMDEDIRTMLKAYNLVEEKKEDPEIEINWDSMNKTEFKKYLKRK